MKRRKCPKVPAATCGVPEEGVRRRPGDLGNVLESALQAQDCGTGGR